MRANGPSAKRLIEFQKVELAHGGVNQSKRLEAMQNLHSERVAKENRLYQTNRKYRFVKQGPRWIPSINESKSGPAKSASPERVPKSRTLPIARRWASSNPVFLIVPFMPRRVPLSGSGCSAVGAT